MHVGGTPVYNDPNFEPNSSVYNYLSLEAQFNYMYTHAPVTFHSVSIYKAFPRTALPYALREDSIWFYLTLYQEPLAVWEMASLLAAPASCVAVRSAVMLQIGSLEDNF